MGMSGGVISVGAGVPDSELNRYFQVKNTLIAFNTMVNNTGPCLQLNDGFGAERSLLPENLIIANNIMYNTVSKVPLIKGEKNSTIQWAGNIGFGSSPGYDVEEGLSKVDPDMSRGSDSLFRPSPASAARGSAVGDYPSVKIDIDGQARGGKKDIGCDQQSDAPIMNVPLTAADVGVSWPLAKAE